MRTPDQDRAWHRKRRWYLAQAAFALVAMIGAAVASSDRRTLAFFALAGLFLLLTLSSLNHHRDEAERIATTMTADRMRHVNELRAHLPDPLPAGWTNLTADFQGWHFEIGNDEIGIWTTDARPEHLRVTLGHVRGKGRPDPERCEELLGYIRGVERFKAVAPWGASFCQFEAPRIVAVKEPEERRREISQLN